MDDKFETNNNDLDSIERLHVDVDSNGMLQEHIITDQLERTISPKKVRPAVIIHHLRCDTG